MYNNLLIKYDDLLVKYSDLSTKYNNLSANDNYFIPLTTPFYLNASNESYIIKGTVCVRYKENEYCSPGLYVTDPKKNMALFDFGPSFGKNLLTPTNSYTFGGIDYGITGCGVTYGWSFQDQVESHTKAVSTLGSTFDNATYQGSVLDAASCGLCDDYMNTTYITKHNIIIRIESDAYVPFKMNNIITCPRVHASMIFDYSTLQKGGNYTNYFVIPSHCFPGTNYCNDHRQNRDSYIYDY
jgi:hypothetical protein